MPKSPTPRKAAAKKPAAKTPKAPAREIDWAAVERDYRAGILTLRQLGALYGVSHQAIDKRAKTDPKGAWVRDLAGKVRSKAAALVANDAVDKKPDSAAAASTEREIVEANAALQANVIRSHRGRLKKLLDIHDRLAERLEHALIEEEQASKTDAKKAQLTLASSSQLLEQLTRVTSKLIPLERQAFGLRHEEEVGDDGDVDTTSQGKARAQANNLLATLGKAR